MRSNWFLTTIAYEKIAEEGKIVKVKEDYIIDALSFTEAEARIIEEMRPIVTGELTVPRIKRDRINEIFFNDEGSKWFKSKVMFITMDEEKGVEKKTAVTMMVQANDIKEALQGIIDGMQGSMADYEIWSITETNIMEVIKYEDDGDK